jgi:hypothetical protein
LPAKVRSFIDLVAKNFRAAKWNDMCTRHVRRSDAVPLQAVEQLRAS